MLRFLVFNLLIWKISVTFLVANNFSSLFSLLVLFVTSCGGGSLIKFNGKMYRKIKGTPYRSTYLCTEKNCEGQVVVNDLKGGMVKVTKHHQPRCMNWVKGEVIVTESK